MLGLDCPGQCRDCGSCRLRIAAVADVNLPPGPGVLRALAPRAPFAECAIRIPGVSRAPGWNSFHWTYRLTASAGLESPCDCHDFSEHRACYRAHADSVAGRHHAGRPHLVAGGCRAEPG